MKPLLPRLLFDGGRWLRLELHVPTGRRFEDLPIRNGRHQRLAMINEHSVSARIMCFFTVVRDTFNASATC